MDNVIGKCSATRQYSISLVVGIVLKKLSLVASGCKVEKWFRPVGCSNSATRWLDTKPQIFLFFF